MFHLNAFFVKERVSLLKLVDTYDIFDPETGAQVGTARDLPPVWAKALRLAVHKHLLPTRVVITGAGPQEGAELVSIRKPGLFWRSIRVTAPGRMIGMMRRPFIAFRTYLKLYDAEGDRIGTVRGDWKGWNFRVLDGQGGEVGVITKKWAGLGKELFTSADNYVVQAAGMWSASADRKALLLATALAIDIVYKEGR